ncbi:hypothetical protein DAPPUDRAFT_223388 [Daphnia pulex]|uniref:RNase H type-1 domain-containing protein n=1 Tax=Daphnia pulex TaxID=6669 RepID=E9GAS3_DAPPU|nr:hypothetical protein DAPPUDRAFT_223388 [Daphnia pulex]|eukprot:EFX83307.1 hypothetical protein DAPPUDRAFT_223388 [Daphnia pulex]
MYNQMHPDFTVDRNGYVIVYIDGACPGNGIQGARGGIGVWFGNNHPLNVSEPLRRHEFIHTNPTNQVAEIKAAIRACELLRNYGVERVVIFTDSQYLIDSITDWIFTWQSNGWRTYQGQPVVHKALYEELLFWTRDFDCVEWSHVPSHYNKADSLAKIGAESY